MHIGKTLVLSTLMAAGILWVQERTQLPASVRVAVVNMQAVLDGYNDGKRRMDDLRKLSEEYNQKIQERSKDWEKLRDQLGQLKADRAAFKAGTLDYQLKTGQMERITREADAIEGEAAAMNKAYGADLDRRKAELVVQIHNDIKAAVASVARSQKIDLVLRIGEDGPEDSTEVKALALTRRQVIHHEESLNITRDVIGVLNTAKAGGGAQDAAGTGRK